MRMKETVAINKSLSALTDVFVAIANKQTHIPFRNSKLTYLLQPALSGDGKTLMMVNLSPTEESYFESLCSLRFAKQVNQCELGKPKRQLKDAPSASISSGAGQSSQFLDEEDTESADVSMPKTPGGSHSALQSTAVTATASKPVATTVAVSLLPGSSSSTSSLMRSTASSAASGGASGARRPASALGSSSANSAAAKKVARK
jgi:hypothetical protein